MRIIKSGDLTGFFG